MALMYECSCEYSRFESNCAELPHEFEEFICNWMIEHGCFKVEFSVVPVCSLDEG